MERGTVTASAPGWSQLLRKLHRRLSASLWSSVLAGRPLLESKSTFQGSTIKTACSWPLVDSEDELLLVGKGYVYDKAAARDGVKFCVLKMEGERWVGVESLGDRLLVLSEYGADSLSADEVVGSDFRRDCVYEVPTCGDLLVYSMGDGGCRRVKVSKDDGGVGYGWLMPSRR
ncbi:uncharacterized protein A4U43_C07F2660 [Asparagus officinalis]|uniref:KIB1-4 beta-propeller domain-containing protein n=1 Tax=Asparagus officinalis TaxID=4686 RepID=A0A5P1E8Y4_ASPOF|nr:uncharacterized protein A4U43_C07F2660 [Asparagus officinalis]